MTLLASGAVFILGATTSAAIGWAVEKQLARSDEARAESYQQLISERTAFLVGGVEEMRGMLSTMRTDSDSGAEAFERKAQQLLDSLSEVTPVLQQAASENAVALAGRKREAALHPDGFTTIADIQMPPGSSATICGGFTVGVEPSASKGVITARVSRQGETKRKYLNVGEATALRQVDGAAAVTFAGFSGTGDTVTYGINFECLPGTG